MNKYGSAPMMAKAPAVTNGITKDPFVACTTSVLHPALNYLPDDAPRAIEFPLTAANHDELSTTLRTYISQLRSGNFIL